MKAIKKTFELGAWLIALSVLSITAIAAVGAATYSISANPQVVDLSGRNFPVTITAAPQPGVVGKVEFSTTPNAAAASSVAVWQELIPASSGTQSATLAGPVTAVMFTRVSGASAVIGEVNWLR